jgi:predicted transcriptional regulator
MKKYFIKGSDVEVKMGEVVRQEMTEKDAAGVRHTVKEVTLTPDTASFLVEIGALEEKEVEEPDEQLDETDDDSECLFDELLDELDTVFEKIDSLEERHAALEKRVNALIEDTDKYIKEISRMANAVEKIAAGTVVKTVSKK